jgi:hypothetical protein
MRELRQLVALAGQLRNDTFATFSEWTSGADEEAHG